MQCNKSNYPFARIICLDHITTASTPLQKVVNNEVDELLTFTMDQSLNVTRVDVNNKFTEKKYLLLK